MKALFIFITLLFAVQAYGQDARYDGVLLDQTGKPVVGVNVRVCTTPATGQPCQPLANLYSNAAGTFPLQNPITTDFLGNFYFYVTSGVYELEFSGVGVLTKQVPDVTITLPGGGGGGSGKLIQVNAVPIPGTTGNLNNTLPAAQAGFTNLNWQQDFGSPITNISVEVPNATTSTPGILEITKDLCGTFTSPLVCGIAGNPVTITGLTIGQVICANSSSSFTNCNGIGSGTMTSITVGNLSPLFTSSVANPTTNASVTYTLDNAGPFLFFGNNTGSTAPPAFEAITSSSLPVADIRRVCMVVIGVDDATSPLLSTDLGPQGDQCYIPYGATVQEVMVTANAGTPSVIPGRNHLGTIVNLVSSALTTAGSGGRACSNTGGTTSLDGSTTCSATLQNTAISQGDFLDLVSGTADGVAKRMTIAVTMTVN
jgi:hypothetical protein